MTRDQKIVAIGAASGVASMALAMWLLSTMVLPAPAGVETLADRLGYALRWAAFAALPLFAMIAAVGNARATGAAIDPTLGLESKAMIVNGRVADNTLQQYVLFLAGSLALAASLPRPYPGDRRRRDRLRRRARSLSGSAIGSTRSIAPSASPRPSTSTSACCSPRSGWRSPERQAPSGGRWRCQSVAC